MRSAQFPGTNGREYRSLGHNIKEYQEDTMVDVDAATIANSPRRNIGASGLAVAPVGFGCMGMSEFYGPSDDANSLRVLHRAADLGVTLFDTAQLYGAGHNEELVGRFLREHRGSPLVVATKWGINKRPGEYERRVDNSRESLTDAIEGSLRRLGVEAVDLYYLHRAQPGVPIEDTVGLMAELVRAGKVKAIGLSEVSAATLRRAHKVHPIAALQTEYSLFTREVEREILPACQELGIAFVAYSPLGRGFLTGQRINRDGLAENDFRRLSPRFADEAVARNVSLLERVTAIASKKGCTPGQLALAWLLARPEQIIPIPGTRRIAYLHENIAAASVDLTADDIERIDRAVPIGAAAGERYPEAGMIGIDA
jgi:aryl-alcohol dehydrogenase-like predicted oxidoreductase